MDEANEIIKLLEVKPRSHRAIREELGLDESTYDRIIEDLLNQEKVSRYQCRGGGLKIVPSEALPKVDEDKLNTEKTAIKEAEERLSDSKAEHELYPYVERWAWSNDANAFDKVVTVGDNHRRVKWENPDLLAISIYNFECLVGRDIEITAFEVKLNFDIYGVWQAANYRIFSDYVYLACYERPEKIYAAADGRLFETVMHLGLGMISMTSAGYGGSGIKCKEILSPRKGDPQAREIDSLLADYKDLLDVSPAGKVIMDQMSSATNSP